MCLASVPMDWQLSKLKAETLMANLNGNNGPVHDLSCHTQFTRQTFPIFCTIISSFS